MGKVNKTRNYDGNQTPGLFPELEERADAVASAHTDPVAALEAIDLKGVANFAALGAELLMVEQEIFHGRAPDAFSETRNALITLLGRNGKAGLQAGQLLIAIKAGLKAGKDWVRYGDLIAPAMKLKSASGLNHIIKRTEHALKLPKKILSAMIELGLEPIDGRNKRLIDNLPRHFEGTNEQARELVRAEQDRVTDAKRKARAKRAAQKVRKGSGAAGDRPAQPLSERLRDCPDEQRLATMEAEVAALNYEMGNLLPGFRLQLVQVEDAASNTPTHEFHRATVGLAECVPPAATETETDGEQQQDADFMEEDAGFPLYPRITEDQQTAPLKQGDRSALAKRIIETRGPDVEAVLGDLPADEQARILDYLYKQITQSCSPAVRQGSMIRAAADYFAPPLQARKGEPLYRAS